MVKTTFTDIEKKILHIVQADLPDSLTPYADIAKEVGTDEATVLNLINQMKDEGTIRRFGVSLKHQKAGYSHNAMVSWIIDEDRVDAAGEQAAKHPLISHVYYRPSSHPEWPYTLYTMIHGRHENEYREVIEQLRQETELEVFAVLSSLKELKKISMTYF
ncbi:winged helix-turn-helix transcriptional regulator [Desulfovibrio subterraneus]|jgi:DNA-binding Lrp family transcriptional regulator|uniref:siroheme decarboxylase n=1 Tax=Desulfovibrio subterraneus TaxID=2718620 RepID=A0A7J0BFI7_9BACT|nr:winged helix-turn-helix transcriptional regulator [Desulfovibrio subterraneus]WBF66758.1 winged helix-turn-helix transcriptional regulator [Desulfovibrio subterraneus]GFM32473.1 transcriptional regulator [Desulfovibrio subterraneus]